MTPSTGSGRGGARGEQTITVGDKDISILFTNRALAEAEQAMGKSVTGIAQGLISGQAGMTEVAHLLRVGMQAARRDAGERPFTVQLDAAYDVLDSVGFVTVTSAVTAALAAVLSYSGNGQEPDPNV